MDSTTQRGHQEFLGLRQELQLPGALPSLLAGTTRHIKKDYEGESEFRKAAETGDIILFRGKKGTSVMQRAITGDEFGNICPSQTT